MDIREVARRSGVSMSTVSRALNDRPEVSPTTRERVMQVASELGYRPNASARALVRRRSDTLGLIWATEYVEAGVRQPFLLDVIAGLKVAVDHSGSHLAILTTSNAGGNSFLRAAREHTIGGVVLMGIASGHPGVRALLEEELPTVGFDTPLQGRRARYVTSDNRAGAASAVKHLVELGHTRIGTVAGPEGMHSSDERLTGFVEGMRDAGLPIADGAVQHGDFFLGSGTEAMRRLLDLPERPTAVFVAGDEMAVGALHAIADAGLAVPRDISVVGFDDIEAATLVRPQLTTVRQDPLALGTALVDELLSLMADAADADSRVRALSTRLVVRGSTAPSA